MKRALCLVLVLPLVAACATRAHWRGHEGLSAQKVEMQMDGRGRPIEIEYHVDPADVPEAVRAAMEALHPGGRATGAEKEYLGRTLYWELTKEIDGREVEAMFLPEGTLHSEEVEVAASSVPRAVRTAVTERRSGTVTKWEEIRDGHRTPVEYHAKISADGKDYKVRASPGGLILAVLREVPAEIEVPVGS